MKTKIRVELNLVVRAERQEDAIEFIRGELAKVPIARMADCVTIEAGEKPAPEPQAPAPVPAPEPTKPAEEPFPFPTEDIDPVTDPGPAAEPPRKRGRKKAQPEDRA